MVVELWISSRDPSARSRDAVRWYVTAAQAYGALKKDNPRIMDWQPIETAPKDGSKIDGWEYCHDAKWRPAPKEHGIENGMRITDLRWSEENNEWQFYSEYLSDVVPCPANEHYTLSHWMPTPGVPRGLPLQETYGANKRLPSELLKGVEFEFSVTPIYLYSESLLRLVLSEQ